MTDIRQLSLNDTAKALGISRRTVERRLASGKLTGRKVDGVWLVDVPATETPTPQEHATNDTDRLLAEIQHLKTLLEAARAERDDWHEAFLNEQVNLNKLGQKQISSSIEEGRRPWYRRIFQ